MRFILSNGEQMRESVQEFPVANELSCSKILVTCVANDLGVIAACGIRSMFNVLVLYVKEGYRGQRIGMQTLEKTVYAAKKRGLSFITLSVSSNNIPAFHLYSRLGFKKIVHLRKPDLVVMMLPIKLKGKISHVFLHLTCFALPNILLAYFHDWLYKRTLRSD